MYIPATPPLRRAKIAVILSSVSMTLLLLRNSHIPLHQSSNFVQSPSNHPRSRTIFFGIPADTFPPISTAMGAGAVDISVSIRSLVSFEVSSVIFRDPNLSDNTSKSFIHLEPVLFILHSYVLHVFRSSTDNAVSFCP